MSASGAIPSGFTPGVAPNGNRYAVYMRTDTIENNYNIIIRRFNGNTDIGWVFFECGNNPFTGGTYSTCGYDNVNLGSTSNGYTFYPQAGGFLIEGFYSADLTYSSVCPTPTPTKTPTQTPTNTRTPTPTPTKP